MNVLLLGAGGNAGMNFTKCLNLSPYPFRVFGVDMNDYYLDTSNCHETVKIDFSDKLSSIKEAVERYNIDIIHAQPDPEVRWLLENAHHFPTKVYPHSLSKWLTFSNKYTCQSKWKEKCGFETYSYLECSLNPKLFTKMLVKSGKVWIRAISGAGSKAALPITSFSQAESWVHYWEETRGMNSSDFVLSEYLPGREFAVQMFFHNGKLIHSQARERLIYFFGALMPSGQTSTPAVARTVSEDRVYIEAEDYVRMIDDNPHGIYCMDMKENSSGILTPTEVNYGRFFTTSDFFATFGVNTPAEYLLSTQPDYVPIVKINTLSSNIHWIRGLDKLPQALMKFD